jgi:F0F1-type ATP synthase gamma subunit
VQALKALVILMGVMIVAALGVIVVTIINRSQDAAQRAKPYEKEISLPAGEILDMTSGPGEVTLRYRLPDGTEQLIVIDTDRGRLRGILGIARP